MTIQEIAAQARSHLSNDWVDDMCRHASGGMPLDAWRFAFIRESLDALATCGNPDDVEMEPSAGESDLLDWSLSRPDRPAYCDQYKAEFGIEAFQSDVERLQCGQQLEKIDVLNLVRSYLETRVVL